MKRKCELMIKNKNGTRAIFIDSKNKQQLMNYLNSDEAIRKKFQHIAQIILDNHRVPDLYDKEDINKKAKDVTAMKLFKGGANTRIYCKEIMSETGMFIVVTAELLPKKKNQKNKSEENNLINKIAGYEYEIK